MVTVLSQLHIFIFQEKQKLGTSAVTKLCHRLETVLFPTNVITDFFSRIRFQNKSSP